MRVVIHRQSAFGRKTGVGHYTHELFRCLQQQAGADAIVGYPDAWMWRAQKLWASVRPWIAERGGRPTRSVQGTGRPVNRSRRSWRGWVLSTVRDWGRKLRDRHFQTSFSPRHLDLYHEPNHIPLPTDLPTVVTYHDLSVLLHPHWHPADRSAFFEEHFHTGLARTRHILTVSEFTRQEVIRHLGVAPERVTRVYNGIRPALKPLPAAQVTATLQRLGLPASYLLYLGTVEPRKNLLLLMRAYCALPAPVRERVPLLLVGSWGWKADDIAEYYRSEARHRGVRHLGYLAEEHLAAVYGGARALVYPSLYEGFGLPPLEMMACGGAVLASTAEAVAETCGRRAHLIDPHDLDGWRRAMHRVATDDDWWRSLRQGVEEEARPFTWDRCAAETLRVYGALCGVSPEPVPLAA